MAGKARVHELAKELGVTSKEVLARLSEQGEFVKSASSTVEAPVARRLRESFPSAGAKSDGAAKSNGGQDLDAGLDYISALVRDHIKVQPKSGREATTAEPAE